MRWRNWPLYILQNFMRGREKSEVRRDNTKGQDRMEDEDNWQE